MENKQGNIVRMDGGIEQTCKLNPKQLEIIRHTKGVLCASGMLLTLASQVTQNACISVQDKLFLQVEKSLF